MEKIIELDRLVFLNTFKVLMSTTCIFIVYKLSQIDIKKIILYSRDPYYILEKILLHIVKYSWAQKLKTKGKLFNTKNVDV